MEMDLGFMYAIMAFIAAVSNCLILSRVRATKFSEMIDKELSDLISFFVVFSLVDGIWGLFFSRSKTAFGVLPINCIIKPYA